MHLNNLTARALQPIGLNKSNSSPTKLKNGTDTDEVSEVSPIKKKQVDAITEEDSFCTDSSFVCTENSPMKKKNATLKKSDFRKIESSLPSTPNKTIREIINSAK